MEFLKYFQYKTKIILVMVLGIVIGSGIFGCERSKSRDTLLQIRTLHYGKFSNQEDCPDF